MVQYRAITKTATDAQLRELFDQNVNGIRDAVLKNMASKIADLSPVDTGTYARGHRVARRSGSFQPTETSHGKTRGVAPGPPRRGGYNAMMEGIAALPPDAKNIVFRNVAKHAKYVESIGWGVKPPYQVYAQTRREFNNIVNEAMTELGMKIR